MMKRICLCLLTLVVAFIPSASESGRRGFYSVEQDEKGVWWGVKPDGSRFVPNGVVHINLDASTDRRTGRSVYGENCRAKYGSPEAWATNTLVRLRDLGFNIIGCDSDYDLLFEKGPAREMGFAYAYGLYTHRPLLARGRNDPSFAIMPTGKGCGFYFPNVFHPEYERLTDEYCAKECARRRDDPTLFGYYIANELCWWGRGGDSKSGEGMFDYVNEKLDLSHPARQALERIVAECGGDRTSRTTKERFLEAVAERYFSVNAAAIRRHDPNHMVLGCRFAGLNHPLLMRVAGKYCDVVSFNAYSWADIARNEVRENRVGEPVATLWKRMYDLARRPLMITEWSFVSLDRGHTSSRGAGMRVRTQAERVAAAELYLKTCLALPFVVGTSYFRHSDMPRSGGPEDCAYGLVDERDNPYSELSEMFCRVHGDEVDLRGGPLPRVTPETANASCDAAGYRATAGWSDGRVVFTRTGDRYRLENETGLWFEGSLGHGSLGEVGLGATNVVSLVAMPRLSRSGLYRSEWSNADTVDSAAWNEKERALRLTVSRRRTDGYGFGFRFDIRVTMAGKGDEMMVEVLGVENIGRDRFELVSTYLRPYPCWQATPEGAHSVSSPVYGCCAEATWDQPGEDRTCRVFTYSRDVERIGFVFYSGKPHPDAIFFPRNGNIALEPGRSQVFAESIYLVVSPAIKKPSVAPVKVILDTDMLTDFDDVGALACLHALADAGECEILATLSCTRGNASVAAIEVINSYYGRGNLPVGCAKEIGVLGDVGSTNGVKMTSAEIHAMMKSGKDPAAKMLTDGGHIKYRRLAADYPQWVRHPDSDDAPDANGVYRRALASAPDGSVVICTIGFLTNLRRLLETKGDAVSPLDGRALVAKKVKRLVSMACRYPQGHEYNSMMDPESSRIVFTRWPTEIVFSDFSYGMDIFAGRAVAEMEGPRNPVRDVFRGNIPSREQVAADSAAAMRSFYGMGGRAAWDETAVLAAVRGVERYFNLHRGEYRMIGTSGANEWHPDEEKGRHIRLTEKTDKREIGRLIDELICRGPKKRGKTEK